MKPFHWFILLSFFTLYACEKDEIPKQKDQITLADDLFGHPYSIYPRGEDTLIYVGNFFYHDCDMFPEQKIVYIGLKMEHEGKIKLGWAKISVVDTYKVIILETALQQ